MAEVVMADFRVHDVLRCRTTEILGADNVLQAASVASGLPEDEMEMADGVRDLAQWRVSSAGMVFSVRRRWSSNWAPLNLPEST